jgi:hypothetical protein
VLAAHGVTFDALADDGLVVAGQPIKLSLLAVNRGARCSGDWRHREGLDGRRL